jgi:zinc D-Ala-D-Ala carboxypeptidase
VNREPRVTVWTGPSPLESGATGHRAIASGEWAQLMGALAPSLSIGGLALILGCSSPDELIRPAPLPSPTVFAWVNAAHCVSPCTHPSPTNLVGIDARGKLSSSPTFLFDAAAQPALEALLTGSRDAARDVTVISAYRTYEEQAALWDEYSVTEPGRAARPGHSEHELGLTVDLGGELDWITEHAWEAGFALSYPKGKEKTTGFRYEAWHYRYVGADVAWSLHAAGSTQEEYFEAHPEVTISGDCSDCTAPASSSVCGELTGAGSCEGDVLIWCMQGAQAAVDCTSSGLVCGPLAGGGEFDCVVP